MANDLYQCPCGRQYNDLMYACPACRLPYGHQPLAGNDLSLGVSSPSDGSPAAGWYPDPNGLPSDRYWDGESWTEQTRPQATPPPPNFRRRCSRVSCQGDTELIPVVGALPNVPPNDKCHPKMDWELPPWSSASLPCSRL